MVEVQLDNFDIRAIVASGQCFRLIAIAEAPVSSHCAANAYELVAHGVALRIYIKEKDRVAFDCGEGEYSRVWARYFDLAVDYSAYVSSIPPEDSFLTEAAAFGRGIRILRQDPWEMLITFIISQRKNIPAIQKAVETLCDRYGQPIPGGVNRCAFPTPAALSSLSEADLRGCSLGYRAAYVLAAARMVEDGSFDLRKLEALDDERLHQALLEVPGVGPKVANCVMLFGFYRINAFPRDVWINRMIDGVYGGVFPIERYEGFAGVIQQYMFYYARLRAKEWPPPKAFCEPPISGA